MKCGEFQQVSQYQKQINSVPMSQVNGTESLTIGLMGRVFTNGLGDWGLIPGQDIPKTQKWYMMPPCLTLSIIRYGSRVKWSNPRKGIAPFPTLWCSRY